MHCAKVAKLVDAPGLGPGAARCGGSSPPLRIFKTKKCLLTKKKSYEFIFKQVGKIFVFLLRLRTVLNAILCINGIIEVPASIFSLKG